jgi:membrane-associated phospholipid phosphatase
VIEAVAGMWQRIVEADRSLFLAINHGYSSVWLDRAMPIATEFGLGHVQALLVLLVAVGMTWRTHCPRPRLAQIQWPREMLYVTSIGLLVSLSWHLSTEEDLAALRAHLPVWAQAAICCSIAVFVRLGYCAARKQSSWTGPLIAAIALSGMLSALGKTIPRDRPWWYYSTLERAGGETVHVRVVPGYYPNKVRGFPSGHTASSVAIAVALTILRRRRWVVAGVWAGAIVVAYSRLYLASHWPLDILGAAVVGVFSGIAATMYSRAWARRPVETASAGMAIALVLYCLVMIRPLAAALPAAVVLAVTGWLLVKRFYRPVGCPESVPPAGAPA